jgi:hypothetical protein
MAELTIVDQGGQALLFGTCLLEIGAHAVQQLLCLPIFQEERELMFLRERLLKVTQLDGMCGHRPLMTDLAFVGHRRESLLLGTRLLELGSYGVQQLLSLALFEEQASLMFVRQSLLKLCSLGSMRGHHSLMTDLAIVEQGREASLLGHGLIELGSHAVYQLLCRSLLLIELSSHGVHQLLRRSLLQKQGSLVFLRQSLPKVFEPGRVGDRGANRRLQIDLAIGESPGPRRFRKSVLELLLQVIELAAAFALA